MISKKIVTVCQSALLATLTFALAYSVAGRFSKWEMMQLGGIPLFPGEAFLGLALLSLLYTRGWLEFFLKRELALPFLYLAIGGVILARSLADVQLYGLQSILKGSALAYQALWLIVGFHLSRSQWNLISCSTLLGVASAQFLGFLEFTAKTFQWSGPTPTYDSIHSNELALSLFPFVALFFPWSWLSVINGVGIGKFLVSLFVFYLKRNVLLSALLFSLPLAVLFRMKTTLRLWAATAVGIVIGGGMFSYMIVYQGGTLDVHQLTQIETPAIIQSAVADPIKEIDKEKKIKAVYGSEELFRTETGLDKWIFHNEAIRDKDGNIVNPLGWRSFLWKQAFLVGLHEPLMGVGFGAKILTEDLFLAPAIKDGNWIVGPHNGFLSIFARGGVLLCGSFCALLAFAGFLCFKAFPIALKSRDTVYAFQVAGFLGALLYSFFGTCLESPHYATWFWLFLGGAMRSASHLIHSSAVSAAAR